MTSRERFLTAMSNGIPDRVPVSPDISNYVPCRRTGLPFWDIYFYGKIPLWRAYLDAIDYFRAEAWVACCAYADFTFKEKRTESISTDTYRQDLDAMVRHTTVRTPDGDLTCEQLCFRREPPTPTEKLIKNLQADWKKYRWLIRFPDALNRPHLETIREECHRRGHAFGLAAGYPGFHDWFGDVQNGLEELALATIDCPEILDEWAELTTETRGRRLELMLEAKPDYILFGASGTLTMASPQLVMRYCMPALRKYARMCKEAGVPTVLHSCGRSRQLVDMVVENTDVNCINPLEHRPMGDVDLAEVKRSRGRQIALMGNLHTTDVMLRGTPQLVRQRSIQAMRDAAPGGGFILSTGDQCGRDTPDENIFAMVEAAKEFGVYDRATGQLPRLMEHD